MKFFIDTANLDQIKEMQDLGIIDGVTTNPTLLSKEGAEPIEQLKKICEIVDGPISAEVVGLKTEEMVKEARELAKIAPNIVILLPEYSLPNSNPRPIPPIIPTLKPLLSISL